MSTFEENRPEIEILSKVESEARYAFGGIYPLQHSGVGAWPVGQARLREVIPMRLTIKKDRDPKELRQSSQSVCGNSFLLFDFPFLGFPGFKKVFKVIKHWCGQRVKAIATHPMLRSATRKTGILSRTDQIPSPSV